MEILTQYQALWFSLFISSAGFIIWTYVSIDRQAQKAFEYYLRRGFSYREAHALAMRNKVKMSNESIEFLKFAAAVGGISGFILIVTFVYQLLTLV